MPRPQIKVIRIRQNDLRPPPPAPIPLQHILRHSLHRSHRPHRHKHRRLHAPMRQPQHPPPPPTLNNPQHLKLQTHPTSLVPQVSRRTPPTTPTSGKVNQRSNPPNRSTESMRLFTALFLASPRSFPSISPIRTVLTRRSRSPRRHRPRDRRLGQVRPLNR